MTTLEEIRDSLLGWFAAASSLPMRQVLPAFRWLCETNGCSFEEPTAKGLGSVIDSLRAMALVGGSSRPELEAQIAPFRSALAEL